MASQKPGIVWTIAGSDSGGGAGIQADLAAFHALGTHGCSIVTALTSQNSCKVSHVQYSTTEHLRETFQVLKDDLPAKAIKLGMLGSESIINEVADNLEDFNGPLVCDPVMISTSGSRLMESQAENALISRIFPKATVLTPNKYEAETLLGGTPLKTPEDVEAGAIRLLAMGPKSVLIKGGHFDESGQFAQDYWTDGQESFWLTVERDSNTNTHGTGCTLSSAIAACLAQGYAIQDAVTVAKAYVTQGIAQAVQLGSGPGPVAQTSWPNSCRSMPWITATAQQGSCRPQFLPCASREEWGVYPVVETADWVERLASLGIKDIQLRIKDAFEVQIDAEVGRAQASCLKWNARLWVNDYWQCAVKHCTYGVHLGQEDLLSNTNAIQIMADAGIRLGISTHSYAELARAFAVRPSYISLGPIFPTTSKQLRYDAQGLTTLGRWRDLVNTPLIAIGGISLENAVNVIEHGADGIAVISAFTKADSVEDTVQHWQKLFQEKVSRLGSKRKREDPDMVSS